MNKTLACGHNSGQKRTGQETCTKQINKDYRCDL